MKKIFLTKNYFKPKLVLCVVLSSGGMLLSNSIFAQAPGKYKAPQDTSKIKRSPNDALTTYQTTTQPYNPDSRFVGAAVKAAEILADTAKYDPKAGVSIDQLFSKEDLQYVAKQGPNGVVVLFELVNKHLPEGKTINFRIEGQSEVTTGSNPLVLKNLRAMIASKPALILGDQPQWKENVFLAYMARDYGTKLSNTITITSATREIRETPGLVIIGFDGKPVTIGKILAAKQANTTNKYQAEKEAVLEFREHTFPGKISKENANENYKRALFQLIDLQEGDINRHPESKQFVDDLLTNDLKKGKSSNVVNALKNNRFFDANVPGNIGPVLLTEAGALNADMVQSHAHDKALEIMMLTALHYGERDALKLLKSLVNGNGNVPAQKTNEFTPKRLGELTNHGTEKLKSLGFGTAKVDNMTTSDLVLVAVAAPDAPVVIKPNVFLTLQKVGSSIANYYSTVETRETKNAVMFNPRISLGSRHIEYRAAYDAVDYVPEFLNGVYVNQKGSRITQDGLELRLESDIYFSNPVKIIDAGVKPVIYPQFGILLGGGRRDVGYDNSTTPGPLGAVPQFKNTYINWGAHLGLNVGPILLATDATYLASAAQSNPNERFFDLSQGISYYRYTFLVHFLNFGLGNIVQGKGTHLTIDAEYTGETNNSGIKNRTVSNGSPVQTGNDEWQRDYNRAHPGGVFNAGIASAMIVNGDVKATFAASSFAAVSAGLQKNNFQFKATGGSYNLYTVPINGKKLISSETVKNIFNGNVFGALTVIYHFGSGSFSSKYKKTESYQTTLNGESPRKTEESSTEEKSGFGPRNHAIFTNGKARLTPAEITPTEQ